MADTQPMGARACVECGSNFVSEQRAGPRRTRCYDCAPARPKGAFGWRCLDCGIDGAQFAGKPRKRCPDCAELAIQAKAKERWAAIKAVRDSKPRISQCADCGVNFTAAKVGAIPKRCDACAWQNKLAQKRARRVSFSVICQGCGVAFHPKKRDRLKYCGRSCSDLHRVPTNKGKRTEAWPYTRVRFRECLHCNALFAARSGMRHCSQACVDARLEAAKQKANAKARERTAEEISKRPPISGHCVECGTAFVRPRKGPLSEGFCSSACGKRHAKRINRTARRAMERAQRVESVNPFKVFERDGWRCQCCKRKTPRQYRGSYRSNAPELDHIIPLSKGGEHSYRNTQLLCRACNANKSDCEGGQLRLFG